MSAFVAGLELCRRFYVEAVRPVVDDVLAGRPHSAARIGSGSEVLGFDTERSADHEWGPRAEVFLRPEDLDSYAGELVEALSVRLPRSFLGFPTNFGPPEDAIRVMTPTDGPVSHRVEVTDPSSWFRARIGFDPADGVGTSDWLGTATQRLAEATAGAVFHDGLGTLGPAREAVTWYPPDIWRYALASCWRRIAQEEPFVGRTGEVGDDIGSALVTARLCRELMRLCLLMDRVYPPYSKWLGSAFARLPIAEALRPHLATALAASTLADTGWRERQDALVAAYGLVAERHNRLGLTEPLDGGTRRFHTRPYWVLDAERFAVALTAGIRDPAIRELPAVGPCDGFIDSTDAVVRPELTRAATRAVYDVAADLPR